MVKSTVHSRSFTLFSGTICPVRKHRRLHGKNRKFFSEPPFFRKNSDWQIPLSPAFFFPEPSTPRRQFPCRPPTGTGREREATAAPPDTDGRTQKMRDRRRHSPRLSRTAVCPPNFTAQPAAFRHCSEEQMPASALPDVNLLAVPDINTLLHHFLHLTTAQIINIGIRPGCQLRRVDATACTAEVHPHHSAGS